jgi:hypothetical protein
MKPQSAQSPEVKMLIGHYDPEIQRLIHAARHTLHAAFPGATETPDVQAHLLGYSYGPGYKGTVATLILSKTDVKLGIPYGASLEDPEHLLAGAGKVHRHVAVRELGELEKPALRALLKKAFSAWETRTGRI